MSNKETGKIVIFDKDVNGLHVAPSSDMSNGACENETLCSKMQVVGAETATFFTRQLLIHLSETTNMSFSQIRLKIVK